MYPSVTVCYGWIIRDGDGSFVNERVHDAFWTTKFDWSDGLATWCDSRISEAGIEAAAESFGYDLGGVALVANEPRTTFHKWANDYSKAPVIGKHLIGKANVELQDVLDLFELHEARLGDPQWLLLVSYG